MDESILKDKWFVEVRGQVTNRSTWQIVQDLISAELNVVNRISRDRTNWKAICNEEHFEQVINKIIEAVSAEVIKYGEKSAKSVHVVEQSDFANLKNVNLTITEQLEHAEKLKELNLSLGNLRQILTDIDSKKKMVIDLGEKQKAEELHVDDQNDVINAPSNFALIGRILGFFNLTDKGVRRNVMLVVSVVAIIVGGAKIFLDHKKQKLENDNSSLAQAALQAIGLGDYDKAIKLSSNITNLDHLDYKTLVQLADAHAAEKKYDRAIQLLSKAAALTDNPHERSQIFARMGLLAIHSRNFDAANNYLHEAMKTDSIYATLFNLAVVDLNRNDPLPAESLLLKITSVSGHESGPVLLALYEAAALLDKQIMAVKNDGSEAKYVRLAKVSTLLATADPLDTFSDEMLAAQVAIAATRNSRDEFGTLVYKWLNTDPLKARPKKFENDIDYERTTWSHIYDWCLEVYKNPNLSSLKSAFFAGCLLRSKGAKEAVPYAQFAMDSDPHDPMVRAFMGYLVFQAGNTVAAKEILLGGSISGATLGREVLAQLCQSPGDSRCTNALVAATASPAAPARLPTSQPVAPVTKAKVATAHHAKKKVAHKKPKKTN